MRHNDYIILTGAKISRKGLFTLPSTLFTTLKRKKYGVPSLINHDMHRLLGIITPELLVFDPENVRLLGRLHMAESNEENCKFQKWASHHLSKDLIVSEEYKNELLKLLSNKIKTEVEIRNIGHATVAIGNEIVPKQFPELFIEEDEDGLLLCNKLEYIKQGVFKYKDVILFANKFFRRSMSHFNNFNEEFLDYYLKLEGNFIKKIALDNSLIGLPESLLFAGELDYWWGPKFDVDVMNIADGVTRHESGKSHGLRDILGIDYTDFRWYKNKENNKVFECEEVLNIPAFGINENSYANKYSHAIFTTSKSCMHLDGAIRIYNEEQILRRWDSNLAKFDKEAEYKKIWRIDGNIDIKNFLELIHYYFRSNTLISEYFDEENMKKELSMQRHDNKNVKNIFDDDIIGKMDSIIASIGYTYTKNKYPSERHLSFQESLDKEVIYDFSLVDLLKLFKQNNIEITYDKGRFIAYEDLVINIPTIYHTGKNSFANAQTTIKYISEFIKLYEYDYDDRLISFTIACQFSDKINEFIFYSFCGSLEKISVFFEECKAVPDSYEKMEEHCDSLFKYLYNNHKEKYVGDNYMKFLLSDGKLFFTRKFIEIEDIIITEEVTKVKFKENLQGDVSSAFLINEAICINCQNSYFICDCIQHLPQKGVKCTDGRIVGFFHTDRGSWKNFKYSNVL